LANEFPLSAAINTLLKICHAFLDVANKHVVLVDLGSASLDDLVADLCKKTLHSFWSIIKLTQFPNDSDAVESLWKNLWNIFRLGLLNFSAWL